MMVELLGGQGDAGHPAERGVEVGEAEGLDDGVPALGFAAPAWEVRGARAVDIDPGRYVLLNLRLGCVNARPVGLASSARL